MGFNSGFKGLKVCASSWLLAKVVVPGVLKESFMVHLTLQNARVHSFKSQGTNHPTTWYQITRDQSPNNVVSNHKGPITQQRGIKSQKTEVFSYTAVKTSKFATIPFLIVLLQDQGWAL